MPVLTIGDLRAIGSRTCSLPVPSRLRPALAAGALLGVVGAGLIGPQVAKSFADDAGMVAFLLSEGARRVTPPHREASLPKAARAPAALEKARSRHLALAAPRVHRQHHFRIRIAANRRIRVAKAKPVFQMAAALPRPRIHLPPAAPAQIARSASTPAIPALKLVNAPAWTPQPIVALATPSSYVSPLLDPTLRRGDAVMTQYGFRIFRGSRTFPYAQADFRPLASASGVPHRATLLAIERATPSPGWSAKTYLAAAPPTRAVARIAFPTAKEPIRIIALNAL